jgi:two-component system LytT family sensor kinase
MFKYLINNFTKRIAFALILALAGGILLEIVFRLQYRNFLLMQAIEWYLFAIVLTILFIEIVNQLNKWLDRIAAWEKRPVYRLNIQIISYSLLGIFVFTGLRLIYVFLFSTKQYILLTDELTIAIFIVCMIIILNAFDFGLIVLNQWRYSLAQAEKYKKESAEFEFEMLQAQINPHFLFNSLNTLSSLVYEDADKAAEFIRKLSDVYRHVLETRQKEVITLREELSFIESYIFLLELRFARKLNIEVSLSEELKARKIAPLSLQMLIENAVKHNIVSDKRPLHIKIYNNDKYIIVENPLQPKANKEKGSQMGLHNISNRYKALCGEGIIILEDDNKFIVKIPII